MKFFIKAALVIISIILSFYLGVRYAWIELDERLLSARKNDPNIAAGSLDPIKSINDDFRRIADEKLLLKKHLEISESYLEKGDVEGLKKWINNMKINLSNDVK
jgi:hypothetical protein